MNPPPVALGWHLCAALACALAVSSCQRGDAPTRPAPSAMGSAAALPSSPAPSAASSSEPPTPIAPAGYLTVHVHRVVLASTGGAVLLRCDGDGRVLPIFIGGTEAISIGLRHETQTYSRPLTHDLLDSVVGRLGGKLVKVHVDSLAGSVFIGRVFFRQGDRTFDVDARPSDAIALALGNDVPIFVASKVLDVAAIPPEDLPSDNEVPAPRTGRPDEPTQL